MSRATLKQAVMLLELAQKAGDHSALPGEQEQLNELIASGIFSDLMGMDARGKLNRPAIRQALGLGPVRAIFTYLGATLIDPEDTLQSLYNKGDYGEFNCMHIMDPFEFIPAPSMYRHLMLAHFRDTVVTIEDVQMAANDGDCDLGTWKDLLAFGAIDRYQALWANSCVVALGSIWTGGVTGQPLCPAIYRGRGKLAGSLPIRKEETNCRWDNQFNEVWSFLFVKK